MTLIASALASAAMLTTPAPAEAGQAVSPQLQTVYSSDLVINGVTTSADGRLFLPVQRQEPDKGPSWSRFGTDGRACFPIRPGTVGRRVRTAKAGSLE